MPEIARTVALFSVAFLLASLSIWALYLRGPLLRRLDGSRASNEQPAKFAVQVLIVAFGLSAVAAMFAMIVLLSA